MTYSEFINEINNVDEDGNIIDEGLGKKILAGAVLGATLFAGTPKVHADEPVRTEVSQERNYQQRLQRIFNHLSIAQKAQADEFIAERTDQLIRAKTGAKTSSYHAKRIRDIGILKYFEEGNIDPFAIQASNEYCTQAENYSNNHN